MVGVLGSNTDTFTSIFLFPFFPIVIAFQNRSHLRHPGEI